MGNDEDYVAHVQTGLRAPERFNEPLCCRINAIQTSPSHASWMLL
jgi:hypothetical protein